MILKINGESVDYTLENEKNAYEIVTSIFNELAREDALVVKVEIDGKSYLPSDESLKELGLEDIKVLEVTAQKKDEIVYELLFETQRLLREVKNEIRENNLTKRNEIVDVLSWIRETLDTVNKLGYFHASEASTMLASLDKIIKYIVEVDEKGFQSSAFINVIDTLEEFIRNVREKLVMAELPKESELKEMVNKAFRSLPTISEDFQTGNDKGALEKVEELVSTLEICCVYLRRNIRSYSKEKQEKLSEIYERLNSLLMRIVDAFENQDVVLISDLLEYELSDSLKNYIDVMFE